MTDRRRIVIVDDEVEMVAVLREFLEGEGFEATGFTNPSEALKSMALSPPDLCISDYRMQKLDGIQLLEEVKTQCIDVPVILITAFGSIDLAIEATQKGAFHFITKPFRMKEVLLVVERALQRRQMERENVRLQREIERRYRFGEIIGKSASMRHVFSLIERVANTHSNVLVLGESGTGKELVARAIHYNSHRRRHPFVGVNCSALPEGLLESELFGHVRGAFTNANSANKGLFLEATDGTLFLDEIGDMSASLQAKLLRAVQERSIRPVGGTRETQVSTRIVAATNHDLRQRVKDGDFREDLYYRLSVIPITIPPLRDRTEDIPLLVSHFVASMAREYRIPEKKVSVDAMRHLLAYDWPGNVRELENVIERAHVMSSGETIETNDVRECLRGTDVVHSMLPDESDLPTLAELERRYIVKVLRATRGNKDAAARTLGVNRRTLYRWRQRYNLDSFVDREAP